MAQLVWGLLAIAVGALFCFRGYGALRTVIAIWGGFVGFTVGALLAAAATQQDDDDGLDIPVFLKRNRFR